MEFVLHDNPVGAQRESGSVSVGANANIFERTGSNGNGNGKRVEKKIIPFYDGLELRHLDLLNDKKLSAELSSDNPLYTRAQMAKIYRALHLNDRDYEPSQDELETAKSDLKKVYPELKNVSDSESPTFTDYTLFAMLCEQVADKMVPKERGFLYLMATHALNSAMTGGKAHEHAQVYKLAARINMKAAVYLDERGVDEMEERRDPNGVRLQRIREEIPLILAREPEHRNFLPNLTIEDENKRQAALEAAKAAYLAQEEESKRALVEQLQNALQTSNTDRLFPPERGGIRGSMLEAARRLATRALAISSKSQTARALNKVGETDVKKMLADIQRLEKGFLEPNELRQLILEITASPRDKNLRTSVSNKTDSKTFTGFSSVELSSFITSLSTLIVYPSLTPEEKEDYDSQPLFSKLRLALATRLEHDLSDSTQQNDQSKMADLRAHIESLIPILEKSSDKAVSVSSALLAARYCTAEGKRAKTTTVSDAISGSLRQLLNGFGKQETTGQKDRNVWMNNAKINLDIAIERLKSSVGLDIKTKQSLETGIAEAYVAHLVARFKSGAPLQMELSILQNELDSDDLNVASRVIREQISEIKLMEESKIKSRTENTAIDFGRERYLKNKLQTTADALFSPDIDDKIEETIHYVRNVLRDPRDTFARELYQPTQREFLKYLNSRIEQLSAEKRAKFEEKCFEIGGLSEDERQELAKLLSAQH